MPNVQPTYPLVMAKAVAGMIADMRPSTVLSRVVEGVNALGFGVPTVRGSKDNTCGPVGLANSQGFLGISVRDVNVVPGAVADVMVAGHIAPVITEGAIWVVAKAACTPGNPVYFTSAGELTNVSTSNTLIVDATFETTAGAGELAIVVLR